MAMLLLVHAGSAAALRGAAARAAARDASWADMRYRGGDYRARGRAMHMRPQQASFPVQGDSLRTWSNRHWSEEQAEVDLYSDGRPIDAEIEMWQGPGYTPRRMRVYSQDGNLRPFRTGMQNAGGRAFAVRNRGPIEFPLDAHVVGSRPVYGSMRPTYDSDYGYGSIPSYDSSRPSLLSRNIQGGASWSFPFDASIGSIEVHLETEGRDLNAKIEVLQGPNNVMQSIDIEEDDGYLRPFSGIFETLGVGTTVRIVNTGPIEFPIIASIVPHRSMRMYNDRRPAIGGGSDMMSRGRASRFYDDRGVARGWWERESLLSEPRSSRSRWY